MTLGQSGTERDKVVQKDLKDPKKGPKGPFDKVCPGLCVCPSLCHSVSLRQWLTELNRVRQSNIIKV